jgi:hypothetical protein
MGMHGLTHAAVAIALLGVPLAPLYCGGDDPGAMACCREQANECNQPGAQDDDCCRDTPQDDVTVTALGPAKAYPLAKVQLTAVAGSDLALSGAGAPLAAVHVLAVERPLNRPPPPLSVLRI